ncbi:hypothetical protein TIFTF001_043398, partial [Ficus carica]
MKTEWGVAKFIDQKTFKNPSNGFLLNDKCTFGVELFIIQNTIKGKRLTVLEEQDEFTSKFKWRILMNPNGFKSRGRSNTAVISLQLDTSTLPPETEFL